jgi:hypothetical protein
MDSNALPPISGVTVAVIPYNQPALSLRGRSRRL